MNLNLTLNSFACNPCTHLCLQGSNDGALTENARVLSKLLQQRPQGSTRFVEMPGVGHIPMDEAPQQLNELLIDFVQQAVGSGSK